MLSERAGPAIANADLIPVGADVLPAAEAPGAVAAAEHGVAGDPAPDPGLVDPITNGGDGSGPFMPNPDGVLRLTGFQVRHLAGEELDVGAADAGPFHVDDDPAGPRLGRGDVPDLGLAGPSDDEGAHYRAATTTWRWTPSPSMPSSMTSPGRR